MIYYNKLNHMSINNHMATSLGQSNAQNPSAPEYLKPWKQENNAGCFCSNCNKPIPPFCVTIINHSTRSMQNLIDVIDPCDPGCIDGLAKPGCSG